MNDVKGDRVSADWVRSSQPEPAWALSPDK